MQEKIVKSANKSQFLIRLNLIKGAKGWEIGDFARAIGVTNSVAANYLTGRTQIPGESLYSLVHGHQINVHWLLTGEGEMYNIQQVKEGAGLALLRDVYDRLEALETAVKILQKLIK